MDQKKWKRAAGALAAVVVLGAGSAGVYAYRTGIRFQPSGNSRELQMNQVQFSQDDSAKQEGAQNSDDNAWWKDDQADNSEEGFRAQDQADYLFEDTKQLPTTVRPSVVLNQGGTPDRSNSGGDSSISGSPDEGGYDISGDRDTADIVIKGDTGSNNSGNSAGDNGNGTGKDDTTGGSTNGNQGNTGGGNGNTGGDNKGDSGNTGGNDGGNSGDDTPAVRPADSARDPEVTKPRPSVSGNYESIKEGSFSKDDENLYVYIGMMMGDTTALYRGADGGRLPDFLRAGHLCAAPEYRNCIFLGRGCIWQIHSDHRCFF